MSNLSLKRSDLSCTPKLIDIRRERCLPTADPKQQSFWLNERWDLVAMSRTSKSHFWELAKLIPITSSDPTRWNNVIEYVKKCPEKPYRGSSAEDQHLDAHCTLPVRSLSPATRSAPPQFRLRSRSMTRASPHRRRSVSRSVPRSRDGRRHAGERSRSPRRSATISAASPQAGLDRLRAMSAASPKTAGKRLQKAPSDPGEFATFIAEKLDVDTANFAIKTFTISSASRFKRKCTPSKALEGLPSLNIFSEEHRHVYKVYHRKLSRAVSGLQKTSSEWRKLKSLAEDLNMDMGARFNGDALLEVLARLRTSEFMTRPPQ